MPGFVTSMDVEPPETDGKLGNQRVKDGFHLLPLGEIRVPFHLFFQGSFLT